jgi:uncharacterized protein (TIGR02646 family)
VRHVPSDLVREKLPDGWEERAQEAADAVTAARPDDRAAEINRRSAVWQELKETLKGVSQRKCWYCESVDARSDNAVDHFRPKNTVAECADHHGYWWLAFNWENYRFCCTFCNCRRIDQTKETGGGKADHFPLWHEERRAKTATDDLANEEPLLLDPAVPADPGFLWFDETGQAMPNPVFCGNVDGYACKRAGASMQFYHLNHTDIVERRKALCADVRRRAAEADRYFQKYDAGDGTAREAFENTVAGLRDRLLASAEYSATARATLMGLRGTHPVVDVVLASA